MNILKEEESKLCDGEIGLQEISSALNTMVNNKSPGNDGLPKEFYLAFFPEIGDMLQQCLNTCYKERGLTASQKQAVITLIAKPGKDVRQLKAWRPISLLNVDYKILSKILATRLNKVLPSLIGEEQSAFVRGRYIGEPIRLISDIITYSEQQNKSGILFAADFEAAFDSIDYQFMLEILKKYGFSEYFFNWISIMHTDPESCVMNNGSSTGYFQLNRGTRQGDPIAPYLFILVIEVLAKMVQNNKSIKGLTINGVEIKQCIFADDTTYFLKDEQSLKKLISTIEIFSFYASLKVNYDKSEAAWIGVDKQSTEKPINCRWVNLCQDAIKILGIHFSYNSKLLLELNFNRVLDNFKISVNMWKTRKLTLFGRTQIVKSLALPKILYVCNMMDPPSEFVNKVNEIIKNFLWNGKKAKVKYKTIISKYEKGGLQFPDLETKLKTQRILWVKKLITSSLNARWHSVCSYYLQEIGGLDMIRSNFDRNKIPSKLPKFYKTCLKVWSDFVSCNPTSVKEILIQPLWNNAKLNKSPKFNIELFNRGIHCVADIVDTKGTFLSLEYLMPENSLLQQSLYMIWFKLLKSVPKMWVDLLKESISEIKNHNCAENYKTHILSCWARILDINKIHSPFIYGCMLQDEPSTRRPKFEARYHDVNWRDICSAIYKTSIEPYSRQFQFRVVHDILGTNSLLYKWKVSDTWRCSYCFIERETAEHLFCYCPSAITLYNQIKQWCETFHVILPPMKEQTILYGVFPIVKENLLCNHIILMFKIIMYRGRDMGNTPTLAIFKNYLSDIYEIETKIATNKCKLAKNNKKWRFYKENV